MDYNTIKAIMESGQGREITAFLEDQINSLRDTPIDPKLPADEYKTNALGRDMAVKNLQSILAPFLNFKEVEKKKIKAESIYHDHTPKRMV